jgi:hypothetical protein
MVQARLRDTGATNINGWELWNEPGEQWDTAKAGLYVDGWTRTYRKVRSLDATTPIIGPGLSGYDHNQMVAFMTNAKNTNTLPDTAVWHSLADNGYLTLGDEVADYRAIERSLGISPRPISINEYGSPGQVDIPSIGVHYMAVLERFGITDAQRAYWYEAGTSDGLFTPDGQPTASYWAYKWYGNMAGNVVRTTPVLSDGVAAYDGSSKIVNVVFGGDGARTPSRSTASRPAARRSRSPCRRPGRPVASPPPPPPRPCRPAP